MTALIISERIKHGDFGNRRFLRESKDFLTVSMTFVKYY